MINIHDNMDSTISDIKMLLDYTQSNNASGIVPVMDGIPCTQVNNPYSFRLLIYRILPCYWAYLANLLIIKICAFIGMFLVLFYHYIKSRPVLCFGVALAFALIPFYSILDLSSAGIPLLLFAFLNLVEEKKIVQSYFIILFFGLYSSLVLSGLFICFLLAVNLSLLIIKNKKYRYYLIGMIILGLVYMLQNIYIFKSFFLQPDFLSHRIEFKQNSSILLKTKEFVDVILFSQYHAGTFQAWAILLLFIVSFRKNIKKLKKTGIVALFVISAIYIGKLLPLILPDVDLVQEFQFDRFYFIYPTVCFVLLAFSLNNFEVKKYWYGILILGFIAATNLSMDREFRKTTLNLFHISNAEAPSFKQFYDEPLFDAICLDLNIKDRSKTKTVSVGLFPSILEYNGFYTLDSYQANYPLAYKHKFRTIISTELDKSADLKDYFDNWGSRCYVFSSELGRNFCISKNSDTIIHNLEVNSVILKNLGCQYVFSSVPVENHNSLNWEFCNSYSTPSSYWEIFVYKVL